MSQKNMETATTEFNVDLAQRFHEILKAANLWGWFIAEFGDDYEADEWHHDGWWFQDDRVSYRVCDIFGDHAEGETWRFQRNDPWADDMVEVFEAAGFTITHNSGDEEDAYFEMQAPPASPL